MRTNKTLELIESMNKNVKIENQTREYLNYIDEHKKNVEKAWEVVKQIDNPYIKDNLDIIEENIKKHDSSKYNNDEFNWYRKKYFPIDDNEANEVIDRINEIFKLHYSRNPHHWEYWLDEEGNLDYNKHSEDTIDKDIMIAYIEMLCDWASFGIKKEDPKETRAWYISNKPKIKLFPAEQEQLEDILETYINM